MKEESFAQKFIIYKHTNVLTGKAYIGYSSFSMNHRWKGHCSNANKGSDLVFHKAIRKYGEHAFSHEVLEECDSHDDAKNKEMFWIRHFKTTIDENGYNMTLGGEGNVMTKAVKEKHRLMTSLGTKQAFKDPKIKERHRLGILKALELRKKPEAKKRICESQKKAQNRLEVKKKKSISVKNAWKTSEKLHAKKKIIHQLTLNNEIVATYESARAAARALNLSQGAISCAARGDSKTSGGFKWRYDGEPPPKYKHVPKKHRKNPWVDLEYRAKIKRKGENNGHSKLTEQDVKALRKEFEKLDTTKFGSKSKFYRKHAEILGITPGLICGIIKKRCWKHI